MANKLDRRSTQPLYAQLKEIILTRINQGQYKSGEKIPSELDLCRELDLSRPTVRQAISELVNENILNIVKGKGTFVAAEPERIEIKGFSPFTFSFLAARGLDGFDNLAVESGGSDSETDRVFGLPGGTGHPGYWKISWQVAADSQTLVLCSSLIPIQLFPDLGRDIKENRRMIDITANKYAYLPQKASSRLVVRSAFNQEARLLDITRSAPVLVVNSLLTSRSGNSCEYAVAVMRSDLISLVFEGGRS